MKQLTALLTWALVVASIFQSILLLKMFDAYFTLRETC